MNRYIVYCILLGTPLYLTQDSVSVEAESLEDAINQVKNRTDCFEVFSGKLDS